jgi:glucokinase
MNDQILIGAAIEDNYISAGIVNLAERDIATGTLRRRHLDPASSAEEIIGKCAMCLKDLFDQNQRKDILLGIGLPNLIDYNSGVYLDNNPKRYGSLYNKNIKQLLANELGTSPEQIRINNVDANFFQGEVFAGAVRGYNKSFGITLGMGLGTARCFNAEVEDANLWKTPFKDSIAEDYLSLRWLLNKFFSSTGIEVSSLQEMKSFLPNPYVAQTFAEFGSNLGEFIVKVIEEENPGVVLIGGQMESSYRFFYDIAVKHVRSQGKKTPIVKAILGERAYVIGAATIWSDLLLNA